MKKKSFKAMYIASVFFFNIIIYLFFHTPTICTVYFYIILISTKLAGALL